MQRIKIDDEYIKLDQLLKYSSVVGSGGEAKLMILSGEVKVNGKITTQRGKKIKQGDIVKFGDIEIEVE